MRRVGDLLKTAGLGLIKIKHDFDRLHEMVQNESARNIAQDAGGVEIATVVQLPIQEFGQEENEMGNLYLLTRTVFVMLTPCFTRRRCVGTVETTAHAIARVKHATHLIGGGSCGR